ncbi:DNA polymerase I [Ureibacillus composti]|nr:DNA polymerase I [Ureibacillus composti]
MQNLNKCIQNILLAFVMSCSMTALYSQTPYSWMKVEIFNIPVMFIILFPLTLLISENVRSNFKKVLKFEARKDKRPMWQVGIGMIFYFAQVGAIEVFFRSLMSYNLGGMPLYLVFAFINAFLLTVIYEEIFYKNLSKNTIKSK